MVLKLDLPTDIATKLAELSQTQRVSAEQLVYQFVVDGLAEKQQEPELTPDQELEKLVKEIQAMPPNPDAVIPAEGSLLEALQNSPSDPDFDLETWNQEWAEAEAEIKSTTRQNDIAEGRN